MLQNLHVGKLQSLVSVLNTIPDFRKNNHLLKHSLGNILLIMILAIMSNYSSQRGFEEFAHNNAEILRSKLAITAIPTRSLFSRVCNNLNHISLWSCLKKWFESIMNTCNILPRIVAIDGKFLQGTIDKLTHNTVNQNMISIVSAYEHNLGLVLDQVDMEGKKISETAVFRDMVRDCKNVTITGDALHCSQITVKLLNNLNLNFVLGLKGNNGLLREQLQQKSVLKDTYCYYDSKFKRELKIFTVPDNFEVFKMHHHRLYRSWQNLKFKTLVEVKRTNLKTGKTHTNHYVSNLDKPIQELAQIIQGHWSIENKLHWQKDMVFKEDNHKTRNHSSAKLFSVLITTAINIFRLNGYQSMQKATRKYCNKVTDCLELIDLKHLCF